jgi:hypothetical protein
MFSLRSSEPSRYPADDAGGGAAGDRQRVEVAEQVEDQRATVGRDVHRHRRHLVGLEVDDVLGGQHQPLGWCPASGAGGCSCAPMGRVVATARMMTTARDSFTTTSLAGTTDGTGGGTPRIAG